MIVALTGTNDFARRAELKRLVEGFVAEQGDLALERLDGIDVELGRLLDMVASLPFLSSRRMVILDEPGRNRSLSEHIDQVIEATSDTTDLIIVEPKPDKRLSYYKTLHKAADHRDFPETDVRALGSWLVAETSQKGGQLSIGDANYLLERVGANQMMLSNELDKLLIYDPHITRDTIDLLTEPAPQSTIFELLDAAFAGRTKRALEIYHEQRQLKVEPQQIIAMLAWQLHVLALVKAAGNKTPEAIASEARMSPYTVRKTAGIARNLTLAQVRALVAQTLTLDVRLKSESIDADDALQHLILQLSTRSRQA